MKLINLLHSVRFRLSLWFVAVLAAILVVFSVFVYIRQSQDIRSSAASRLLYRQRELYTALQPVEPGEENQESWRDPRWGPGSGFILDDIEVLLLSDSQGTITRSWGALSPQEAEHVASQIEVFSTGQEKNHFFTDSLALEGDSGKQLSQFLFLPAPILQENELVGWMILGRPIDPDRQLPRLVWTLVLAGAVTLLAALAGGYWLADRALWPVKAITFTAKEISETDLSRRLNLKSRDELGELANTFDRMLDRLQAAFTRQRQFTADASHELRTPLTIIELETGRALAAGRTAEEYRRALQVIHSENEFMVRLVNELLTLARMDAGQVKLKREPLDLSDLALDVVERYAPLAARKGIQLQSGELPELPIEGDRQYLSQMLGNLVDNAIKYNSNGAQQWVRVETGAQPGAQIGAWVRISDNGPGIAAEHLSHLFDRFYRIDSARSHNPDQDNPEDAIPGSGLGLSIVQWIAQVHGGFVTVQSEVGQGTTFEIHIPSQLPGS